jgi:periplasmic divalent cation tolerance protein
LLVLTNCPDQSIAEKIAQAALEQHLAACINLLAPCQSMYRWQGQIESAMEIPLLIKTTNANYIKLETLIKQLHPYEIPEIIALPIAQGLPAYLSWISAESQAIAEN